MNNALPIGTTLQEGKYRIESVLGQGGFSITYKASHVGSNRIVAIKEFYLRDFCLRNETTHEVTVTQQNTEMVDGYRKKFLKAAQILARLHHSNIVAVMDVFENLGSIYYVMEYVEGCTLEQITKKRGALPQWQAEKYIRQVAESLAYVHQANTPHLDIKPGNIMITPNDQAILVDFGISKQCNEAGEQPRFFLAGFTAGYAALEQSQSGAMVNFTPATDIYALGATFYKLLTAQTPPSASEVLNEGIPRLPEDIQAHFARAIEAAMQPVTKNRPQTVSEFLDLLNNHSKEITVNGIPFNMVLVEGGTFQMGSNNGYDSEKPVHQVSLSSYYMGQTEVTQALWQAVMGSNPSYFEGNNQPVERVRWDDCQAFIKKLNSLTGSTYRLPTESEWEFAARGGNYSKGTKYAGSDNPGEVAWYKENSGGKTHAVGTKSPNELGLYDMSGNVWEWCNDRYGGYSSSSQTNPTGAASGSNRVRRGGGFDSAGSCSATTRDYCGLTYRYSDLGLRLVLDCSSNHSKENKKETADESALLEKEHPIPPVSVSPQQSISLIKRKEITVNGIPFNMVLVEGGTFQMGNNNGEDREKPVHQVSLSSYYMGQTEVTQALWQAVMGSNPSRFKGNDQPVERVSWNDCQAFIKELNSLTGSTYRLPTESEWEFAARGGNYSKGTKYAGSNNLGEVAWNGENSGGKTHAVGTKSPNELGLYDMSGNVLEWCNDWYGGYSSSSQTNPTGAASGPFRVFRGGNWYYYADLCSAAYRGYCYPSHRSINLGLRLVLDCSSSHSKENKKETADESVLLEKEHPIPVSVSSQQSISLIKRKEIMVNGIPFNMVLVEGGTFQMGSNNGYDSAKPVHQVSLSSYYMGQTEVTQALWQAVMGSNPSYFEGNNQPVERVRWDDCQAFIKKLNSLTGSTYRLPTESEWEFAARGGNYSKGTKYAGSNNLGEVAWYKENSGGKTHAVGTKSPNELGLYDMSGNVGEWCNDRYGGYSSSSQTNPTGAASGSYRVARGGGLDDSAGSCSATTRDYCGLTYRYSDLGLRLVLDCSSSHSKENKKETADESVLLEKEHPIPVSVSPQQSISLIKRKEITVNGIPFNLVLVEGGTFQMGSNNGYDSAKPVHQVSLSSYYMGQTEVTQALWQAVMGSNPSEFKGNDQPVERVSWDDCQAFIKKLNSLTVSTYRLPTESEWEFAARGGNYSKGTKYAGSNNFGEVAWYKENSGGETHAVGTKSSNELGLYDMSGNVWEWCNDWYEVIHLLLKPILQAL